MKITGLSVQQRDPNRVNVMVDGKYRFSLDVSQIIDLGIKIGKEYDEEQLAKLEMEGQFGKLYARTLEYTLLRPHSSREIRDYLYKKTLNKKYKSKKTGELKEGLGVDKTITERVYERLADKGYIDDEQFAKYWIENRNVRKGVSHRKLQAELQAKGVDRSIIEKYLAETERSDRDELRKIVMKKRGHYDDERKFIAYLARQGFSYDDITSVLNADIDD